MFCFKVTATTMSYTYRHTISRHDALPSSCRTATGMLVMAMAARRQIGRATWFRRPVERVRRLGIEGRQVVLGEPRGVDPQAGKVGVLCAQVFQSHQRLHAFEGQLDLP